MGMDQATAADQVTTLYRVHGMDLIRIAAVMLGLPGVRCRRSTHGRPGQETR